MSFHRVLFNFFVPFCLINLSINVYVSTSQCLVQQQSLLLQLKSNLIFNPANSKKLVHWNQNSDCCQWKGVSCAKGQVISLDLSEEFLTGGLDNSSLFNLQYLQNLNLAYNEFGSLIPTEFDRLKSLRYLNLSNAGFEGQIPIQISHLTNLTTLDLSTSNISQQNSLKLENPDLGMLVQNLTEITELYLDGVSISAVGNEWSHAVSSLLKLHVLSMSSCNLSGPIDPSLAKLQSLQVIRLNLNNLSSSVPKSFENFSNMTTLHLSSCNLRGVFPKGIFQIQTLKALDVSDNKDLQGFLPSFPKDGYLETLNLSNTYFSGKLVSSISNLKQLSSVDISYCQFNGTLPISLSELTQLVHIDLSSNHLSGPLPSFNKSKNLKYLSLFQNELTGTIPPTHWKGLSSLSIINLGYNSLSGKVPTTLFTLPSLIELTLFHNEFEGQLDEFPNASLSTLEMVDLSINNLHGPIPMSFFHLKKLRFLQLSSNNFNGTIKLEMVFQMLPNLQTLGLSSNNLSVDTNVSHDSILSSFHSLLNLMLVSCNLWEIPSFLRNQSQLLILDLSLNHIQGTVPNWIWKHNSLTHLNLSNNLFTDLEDPVGNPSSNILMLDLHSNQIQGTVPFFGKYIAHIDYSNNRFSYLPHDFKKHLDFTSFLSLSNNNLHGRIPEPFCNCTTLRLLDLSHNNFDGSIPECLTESSSTIRVLNLAGNKLTGHISDLISSSCNLRFLDLNANQLSGTIPKSLVNCQMLEVLNLGNNLLSDEFPCFLRNISTLKVLVLRSNRLQGPIRCTCNRECNWEMLRIVDVASNRFTGTLPGALMQSWTAMLDDGNSTRENEGYLFFDLYDYNHSPDFRNVLSQITTSYAERLAKYFAAEPPSAFHNLFSYFVGANEAQSAGTFLDSVIVVNKGLQMKFIKILSIFTSLDFSSNHFEGPIPEELMWLNALNALNLSNNAFSSHIPSSLGNLTQLESLDMSNNSLVGEIPTEIAYLSFLQVLNLSFNQLNGRIPTGTQIQSFEADSFEGNEGLCGPPLSKNCDDSKGQGLQPSSATASATSEEDGSIEWNLLSAELGFIFGIGFVIVPLVFWKRWRVWYNKHVDDLLWLMFPQLDFVYQKRGDHNYRTLRWKHR